MNYSIFIALHLHFILFQIIFGMNLNYGNGGEERENSVFSNKINGRSRIRLPPPLSTPSLPKLKGKFLSISERDQLNLGLNGNSSIALSLPFKNQIDQDGNGNNNNEQDGNGDDDSDSTDDIEIPVLTRQAGVENLHDLLDDPNPQIGPSLPPSHPSSQSSLSGSSSGRGGRPVFCFPFGTGCCSRKEEKNRIK